MERAEREGIHVRDDLVFVDRAKSGKGFKRAKLLAMLAAVKSGRVNTVLLFTLSRFGRSFPRTIQFIEEELVERSVRVIVVAKNIDTAEGDRWRQILYLSALVDDLGIRDTGVHVRAAQEGLFLQGFVCGTVPYGYSAKEVDGPRTKRGRRRSVIEIDREQARWILQIFDWFVVCGLSIREIVRRLNAAGAPPPAKTKRGWTRLAVRHILESECYTGLWKYGIFENRWVSKGDYVKKVKRAGALRSKYFDRCRIVTDVVWQRSQEKLLNWQRRAAEEHDRPDRLQLEGLVRRDEKLTRQIGFIYGSAGTSGDDEAERMAQLRQVQSERATVRRQIAELEAAAEREVVVPSRDEVVARIDHLCRTLCGAAESDTPEDLAGLRRIVEMLTGGRIAVTQQGNPKPKGSWLRLTFRSKLLSHILGQYGVHNVEDEGAEISIDVRRELTHEQKADEIKGLVDEGWPTADTTLLIEEIAGRVGADRNTTTKAINWRREERGLPKLDFRRRRKEVTRQRKQAQNGSDERGDRSGAAT